MKDSKQVSGREPLAMVGIGCRLPGGVRDAESLWSLLIEGRSAITDVPADRWNSDRYYHPQTSVLGRINNRRGGFVDHLKLFDAAFWGISPREAIRLDPQQRWLLETAWKALEDAGIPPRSLRGPNTGVFVGASSHDFGTLQLNDLPNLSRKCCASPIATPEFHPAMWSTSKLTERALPLEIRSKRWLWAVCCLRDEVTERAA